MWDFLKLDSDSQRCQLHGGGNSSYVTIQSTQTILKEGVKCKVFSFEN